MRSERPKRNLENQDYNRQYYLYDEPSNQVYTAQQKRTPRNKYPSAKHQWTKPNPIPMDQVPSALKLPATSNAVAVVVDIAVEVDIEARRLEAPDNDRILAIFQLLAARVGIWSISKEPLSRAGMVH
jgi:hypothetical protein